nr:MAG TPA: hypothetical protein [Caudoviricetes sp.]
MFYPPKKPYFFNNSRYSLKNHLFSKFYPYFFRKLLVLLSSSCIFA